MTPAVSGGTLEPVADQRVYAKGQCEHGLWFALVEPEFVERLTDTSLLTQAVCPVDPFCVGIRWTAETS